MGKDKKFTRQITKRKTNIRILVVCEGEKTEIRYFNALRKKTKLTNVKIDIRPSKGRSPKDVYDSALQEAESQGHYEKGGYEYVFCVFDEDDYKQFKPTISEIQSFKPRRSKFKGEIRAVWSSPCFELWLLYHFQPHNRHEKCSDIKEILVKKYLPNYDKKLRVADINKLMPKVDVAIKHATQSYKIWQEEKKNDRNPSTAIHLMIGEIHKINNENILKR